MYTIQFWLLCLSSFLFFSSFNMIIPELPGYLDSMGGGEYKGFIIALFTLTAGLSRPFSGKLADKVGRIPIMIFGAAVCFICGFLYPFAVTVAGFLLLRLVHGFSTGFKPTGTSAYVADIAPFNRRGEAMGVMGLCGSLGMASGPAMGSTIAMYYPLEVMFYASSVSAILSVLILIGMKETLEKPEPFRWGLLRLSKNEIFEPRVLAPSIFLLLTTFSFGIVLTIAPDLSDHLGIQNKGLFFTCFTIASVAIRFFAGKASDKYGRETVLKISALTLALGMLLLGLAESITALLIGAVIFGLSAGMNTPTAFAWAIDLSHEKHRGRGMATLYISLEIGIGLGALISGWIYSNNTDMFLYTFLSGSILGFLAFLFLQFGLKKKRKAKVV